MDRTGKLALLLTMALLVLSGMKGHNGWADSSMHRNYVRVGLGVNIFTDDMDDVGYDDPGIGFDAAYGRYLTKYLVLEGGIHFFATSQDFSGSTGTAGAYDRDDVLDVTAILATIKGEFPVGPVTLYAGAGIGGYYALLTSDIDTTYLGSFDTDDDDAVFGVHVVLGGYYNITDRFFVGGQGMYRWTGDIDIHKIVATVPVQAKGNLEGYTIALSAGFRF